MSETRRSRCPINLSVEVFGVWRGRAFTPLATSPPCSDKVCIGSRMLVVPANVGFQDENSTPEGLERVKPAYSYVVAADRRTHRTEVFRSQNS